MAGAIGCGDFVVCVRDGGPGVGPKVGELVFVTQIVDTKRGEDCSFCRKKWFRSRCPAGLRFMEFQGRAYCADAFTPYHGPEQAKRETSTPTDAPAERVPA